MKLSPSERQHLLAVAVALVLIGLAAVGLLVVLAALLGAWT